jgi:hypothetical protein
MSNLRGNGQVFLVYSFSRKGRRPFFRQFTLKNKKRFFYFKKKQKSFRGHIYCSVKSDSPILFVLQLIVNCDYKGYQSFIEKAF